MFFFKSNFNQVKTTMNSQAKISAFFSKVSPGKRPNSDLLEKSPKKVKLDHENIPPSPEGNIPKIEPLSPKESNWINQNKSALSPEQKEKMSQNKAAALEKLQEKQTSGLLGNFGESWYKVLKDEFTKPYFVQLSKFVNAERQKGTIYPPENQVFSWTRYCKVNEVKVVILGQDPYHGPKQAHGLCFSVQKGVPPPPSLVNIYKELEKDIEGFKHPGHGTLIGWSQQGVLLLNACMTVKAGQANSHKDKGWEKFTDAVISWLNKNRSGIVFMLWGAYAQKKGAYIDKNKHHILKGVHPSPLSAHRGYFGCKHFSQCNKFLVSDGKTPIDWTRLPPQE